MSELSLIESETLISRMLKAVKVSLLSGTFPKSLKTAVIKPLLKKNNLDASILNNYWPISNLPFVGKMFFFFLFVFNQLTAFLTHTCLLVCFPFLISALILSLSGYCPSFTSMWRQWLNQLFTISKNRQTYVHAKTCLRKSHSFLYIQQSWLLQWSFHRPS